MKLTGHMCAIGEVEDPDSLKGPAMQVKLRDGRLLTLSGLTEKECRDLAPMFLDGVVLTVERGPK